MIAVPYTYGMSDTCLPCGEFEPPLILMIPSGDLSARIVGTLLMTLLLFPKFLLGRVMLPKDKLMLVGVVGEGLGVGIVLRAKNC